MVWYQQRSLDSIPSHDRRREKCLPRETQRFGTRCLGPIFAFAHRLDFGTMELLTLLLGLGIMLERYTREVAGSRDQLAIKVDQVWDLPGVASSSRPFERSQTIVHSGSVSPCWRRGCFR